MMSKYDGVMADVLAALATKYNLSVANVERLQSKNKQKQQPMNMGTLFCTMPAMRATTKRVGNYLPPTRPHTHQTHHNAHTHTHTQRTQHNTHTHTLSKHVCIPHIISLKHKPHTTHAHAVVCKCICFLFVNINNDSNSNVDVNQHVMPKSYDVT